MNNKIQYNEIPYGHAMWPTRESAAKFLTDLGLEERNELFYHDEIPWSVSIFHVDRLGKFAIVISSTEERMKKG